MRLLLVTGLILTPAVAAAADDGYVGSAACAPCHQAISEAWGTTRHAYSVLTAAEARAAGYPLPETEPGDGIRGWDDVSYVVGGRQRITYADRAGRVLGSSYHHRMGGWSAFPEKEMWECGPCHFTAYGSGPSHPDDPVIPGRWVERNIGCESCHGPGAQHVETLDARDIRVDVSSRACGTCHTTAGKVLPRDDLHDTHDMVQVWNRDRHALSVRRSSHAAFCAGCHSPLEAGGDGRVFSESKHGITCVACHNPHAVTDPHYRAERVSLEPPLTARRQLHRGRDGDFTTVDFRELGSTEETCTGCHRGADRIDLDHADATCNDCHNTFHRNRSREVRAYHDANHPGLSCRPCHEDADHLMSILYRDPAFLRPEVIHDLGTVPAEAAARHGLRATGLRPGSRVVLAEEPGNLTAAGPAPVPGESPGDDADGLLALLGSERHRDLAGRDADLAALQDHLVQESGSLAGHVALITAYARAGETAAARELLAHAGSAAGQGIVRNLLFRAGAAAPAVPDARCGERVGTSVDDALTKRWAVGFCELILGSAREAGRILSAVREEEPGDAAPGFHLALAQLRDRRLEAAVATLEEVLLASPSHLPSLIALGAIHMQDGRMTPARASLERAVEADGSSFLAHFFLGRARMRARDHEGAAESLRRAVARRPQELNAWFFLAEAYRSSGRFGDAAATYDELVRRRPDLFHPRNELARLYQYLSDRLAFLHLSSSERAPPPGASDDAWADYLHGVRAGAIRYGDRALAEFRRADALSPPDADRLARKGELLRRVGRVEEARALFEELAAREPTAWRVQFRLGTLALELGDVAAAVGHLERAVKLAPTEGDPYVALGLAYVRQGRTDRTVEILERGAPFEPFNPALYTNLGASYASLGDHVRARQALERSLALDTFPTPRVHLTYTNLALVHLREGDRAAASAALKSALHEYPGYTVARRLLDGLARGPGPEPDAVDPVHNDLLEFFGEVTTIGFDNE